MKINTDDILDAIGAALEDEAKVNEFAGAIALTAVGIFSRRSLRKTLILAGVDEKLAKRIPSAIGMIAAIATLNVLTAKRVHAQAYPDKAKSAPVVNLVDVNRNPVA
jgi:hypothetical protein